VATKKKAASAAAAAAVDGIPRCTISRDGGNLQIQLLVSGLLAAGARFEVIPVFGPVPPTLEETWNMTTSAQGVDTHDMTTEAKHLEGDGIRFQVNLCSLSNQFDAGTVDVVVVQDTVQRVIEPPMHFDLATVPPCQSASAKVNPTSVVGGFAFVLT
jgi:hypothetical protein